MTSLAESLERPWELRPHEGYAVVYAEAAEVARHVEPSGTLTGGPITLPVLEDHTDRPRDLSSAFAGRPVLLFFYPGGWSPPCMAALRRLERRRADLEARNIAVVAATADSVARIAATREAARLGFLVVHDHGARFAQGLGLSWRTSSAARLHLRSHGIRLADWTGGTSPQLTLAATLLIDDHRTATAFVNRTPTGHRDDLDEALAAALAV